ncbi:hypothetical protein AAC387_Pa06g0774 [Persea americana]
MEQHETMTRFSSCRGVSFEINPTNTSPFALPTHLQNAAEGTRFRIPWTWSRRISIRVFPRSQSKASSHFCNLSDKEDDDEEKEEEEEEMSAPIDDVEKQKSSPYDSHREQEKPLQQQPSQKRVDVAKGKQQRESRLRVILLDQGLLTVYKRLFALFFSLNVTALVLAATGRFPYARGKPALFSIINVLALTICRSEALLRVMFWLAVKVVGREWVPLWIKTSTTSLLQSLGGVHSSRGIASIAWLVYALILTLKHRDSTSNEIVAVASAILFLLFLSTMAAFPLIRHLHHNVFEQTHRVAGWAALALLWIFIILTFSYDPSFKSYNFRISRLIKQVEIWLTLAITLLILLPWVGVRRVAVIAVAAPSGHASLIKFNGGVEAGILGRISRSPISDWHAFGIISDGEREHMMLAGAVGDFTKDLVSDPPTHLWVRKVQFAGLPYLVNMYRRVVLVATGSGICVFLSFLLQPCAADVCLVWVAKGIEMNFGKEIKEMVSGFPKEKVIVHDTAILGRPNVAEMSVEAARRWKAEVVIVTSNPQGSRDVVNACKGAGIPAFGLIWDS